MRQPYETPQSTQAPQAAQSPRSPQEPEPAPKRDAGRSLDDPSRPLGEDILQRSVQTVAPTRENFHDRARQAAEQAAVDRFGVAERAKVIGVLRKAEELMSTANPSPDTDAGVRRALELACGRVGLTYPEYRALADHDPDLVDLERSVIADARRRWSTTPGTLVTSVPAPEPTPPPPTPDEGTEKIIVFDRIFVPVDYSIESHRAVRLALELRRTRGSAVCLFHAVESTGSDDWLGGIGSPAVGGDWVAEAHERLRRFLANLGVTDDGIAVRARIGRPLRMLCDEARDWGATLVVAAARVHASLVRSPAERLVRQLGLPVLVIPE